MFHEKYYANTSVHIDSFQTDFLIILKFTQNRREKNYLWMCSDKTWKENSKASIYNLYNNTDYILKMS